LKVTLIASTRLEQTASDGFEVDEWLTDPNGTYYNKGEIDHLEEFAGRACYQSWNRPNINTAYNDAYMAHILQVGHESVLEHATAAFYIEGVTRTLTHELVRHRHLSYSQKSQRYVDESEAEFTIPADLMEFSDTLWGAQLIHRMHRHHDDAKRLYADIDAALRERKLGTKRSRGAARAVLPGNVHTSIVVSGNMRAWRDFMRKRWHVAAEREIRELAGIILSELRSIAANTFQDIPEVPFGSE
jgi:thymidylate synthase (FAD)